MKKPVFRPVRFFTGNIVMVKKYLIWALLALVSFSFLFVGFYLFFPDIAKLKRRHPAITSFMEYRIQEWEREGRKKKVRQFWTDLSHVSPYAIKAVIIAEDDKFWSHEGFDFEAMHKALLKDIKKRKFKAGGSTISQQLVKNLYLSPEKSPLRKIKEAIITWRMERNLSKRRIIEIYLNVAEWGDGIFGIEAAARHYYGKPALYLTATEAARLAAVLPNPRKYLPTGTAGYVENRASAIYRIMVKRGVAIPEYEAVMSEPGERASPSQGEAPAPQEAGGGSETPPVVTGEKPEKGTQGLPDAEKGI
jgi:monofunctional biosynthetic peptidoglycan transglycosylase